MKQFCILLIATFALTVLASAGDKNDSGLNWITFDSARVLAAKADKPIFMDVYTDWCGWCKKMDAGTYSDSAVVRYMNTNYYLVKLNAEADGQLTYQGKKYSNAQFTQAMGVSGYPTIAFFKPDGELYTTLSSYLPSDKFLPIARFIGDGAYKTMSWEDYAKKNNVKLD